MKLTKVLCFAMLLAVIFSFTACDLLFGGTNTPETTKYTVEFDSAGGSDVASQSIEENQLATKPADPTKEGYTFLGWFLGETEWNFAENKVTKAITLIAKWQKVEEKPDPVLPTEYTITYFDGETALNLTPNKFTSESTGLTLPAAPAKAHYEFAGWFSDADFKNEVTAIDVNAGKNLTLYAKYQAKAYRITYNLDNGTNNAQNPASYTVENLPVELLAPTKEGYDFLGWYTEYNYVNKIESITLDNIGNLDLYAKWEVTYVPPVTYTITYLAPNGETLALTPAEYQESASEILLPTYEDYNKETHIFKGWSLNGATVTVLPAGTTGDITLTAVLEEIIPDVVYYTLTYMLDGAQYGEAVKYEEGTKVDLVTPEKAGHKFSGWTQLGQSIPVTSITLNKDVTVYGSFTAIDYKITYFVNGSEYDAGLATYQISDTALALPAVPAMEGFKIVGWLDAAGDKVTEIKPGQTGDLTLTAAYEEIIYVITYELQGGVNNADNVSSCKPGEVPALYNPENRNGYLFLGWYTDASYTEQVTSLEGLTGDITLWAKWMPNPTSNSGSTTTPEVPL